MTPITYCNDQMHFFVYYNATLLIYTCIGYAANKASIHVCTIEDTHMYLSSIVILTVTHPIRGDAAKSLYKLDNMLRGKTYYMHCGSILQLHAQDW